MRRLITFLIAGVAASACASPTSIEQQWRAPVSPSTQLRNIVTLCPSSNEAVRRGAEDKLASRLIKRGVHAVPAYTMLQQSDLSDRTRVSQVLRTNGFDGMVVMRFVDREQKLDVDPYYGGYWGTAWDTVIPETIVRIEINAYSLSGDRLVWSGLSKSVDPENVSDLIDQVTAVVSKQLDEKQVLARAPAPPDRSASR